MGSLLNSMSLVLEEFYNHLSVIGVSAMTGEGVDDFFAAIEEKREEFEKDYRPELERRRAVAEEQKNQVREQEVSRMMKDMQVSSRAKGTGKYSSDAREAAETVSDLEAEDADEDDDASLGDGRAKDEDEDEDAVNEAFEESLKARYEAALRESGGAAATAKTGSAAASYIRSSQR
jgi:hypothetical protein